MVTAAVTVPTTIVATATAPALAAPAAVIAAPFPAAPTTAVAAVPVIGSSFALVAVGPAVAETQRRSDAVGEVARPIRHRTGIGRFGGGRRLAGRRCGRPARLTVLGRTAGNVLVVGSP